MHAPDLDHYRPFDPTIPPPIEYSFEMVEGVFHVTVKKGATPIKGDDVITGPPRFSKEDFVMDWNLALAIAVHGPM